MLSLGAVIADTLVPTNASVIANLEQAVKTGH